MNRLQSMLAASLLLALTANSAFAQQPRQIAQNSNRQFGTRTVPLEDQLMKGLRVTLPRQAAFVKRVVAEVDQNRLPQGLVNLVYKWALEKNAKVPFPYFQFAMRELAGRRGIALTL